MTDNRADDDRAIRDLLACYALALDTDDIDRCLDLFTDDGEFLVFGREFSGRDQIRAMFESAPRGLHLTGVSSIEVSGDAATARSQVLLVEAGTMHLRLQRPVRRRTEPRRHAVAISSAAMPFHHQRRPR